MKMRLVTGDAANEWAEARLRFLDCTHVLVEASPIAMSHISGAILESECSAEVGSHAADLNAKSLRSDGVALAELVVFTIQLVLSTCRIVILARDFELRTVGDLTRAYPGSIAT